MRRASIVATVLAGSLLAVLVGCGTATTTAGVSAQPPAGWMKYTGGGTEIYLPPSFDLNLKDATTLESLRALAPDDPEAASWLSSMESSPCVINVGEATGLGAGPFMATVGVFYAGESTRTLQESVDYMKSHLADMYPGGKVVTQTSLTVDGHEAAQMMIDLGKGWLQLMTAVYTPSGVWAIYMGADTAQMQQRLADFQTSVSTFRIVE